MSNKDAAYHPLGIKTDDELYVIQEEYVKPTMTEKSSLSTIYSALFSFYCCLIIW
jgi:hypothetical protein